MLIGYGTSQASGTGRQPRPRHRADVPAQPAQPAHHVVATVEAPARPRVPLVVSPLVRRLARDLEIDLHALEGSGRGGAITRGDVVSHVAGRTNGHAASAAPLSAAPALVVPVPRPGPASAVRR